MRLQWLVTAAFAITAIAQVPGQSDALCGLMPLESNVRQVPLIVAGTVVRTSQERLPSGLLVTHYYFTSLAYAKGGSTADTLVLTAQGGRVGSAVFVPEDGVYYEMKHRYITFAGPLPGNLGKGYGPQICSSGPFVVDSDSVTGAWIVRGSQRWPVSAHGPQSAYSLGLWYDRHPGMPVTEGEFLNRLREIVKEQAATDSAPARPSAGQVRDATPVSPGPPAQEATPPQPPVREHPGQGGK